MTTSPTSEFIAGPDLVIQLPWESLQASGQLLLFPRRRGLQGRLVRRDTLQLHLQLGDGCFTFRHDTLGILQLLTDL